MQFLFNFVFPELFYRLLKSPAVSNRGTKFKRNYAKNGQKSPLEGTLALCSLFVANGRRMRHTGAVMPGVGTERPCTGR
jgi:hypothetical protein